MRWAWNEANRADKEWNRLNANFKARMAATDAQRASTGRPPLSDLARLQLQSDNLELNDAFGVQGWWRTQTMLIAQTIMAEEVVHRALEEES